MTSYQEEKAPSELVRPLHTLLVNELDVVSPLARAVEILDRAEQFGYGRQVAEHAAQAARLDLARSIVNGQRELDDDAVRSYASGDVWVPRSFDEVTPAVALAALVETVARHAAADQLVSNAPAIFALLAAVAAKVVREFEALPSAPPGLWAAAEPVALLTRTPGHELTLGRLTRGNDRFAAAQRGAGMVRDFAGHGFERVGNGAPRAALVYRNWRVAETSAVLQTTSSHFRLWRAVVDGFGPGVWRPADIETTDADGSFDAKLTRLGVAVQ